MARATSPLIPIGVAALAAVAGVLIWRNLYHETSPGLVPVFQPSAEQARAQRPNPTCVGLAVDAQGVYVEDWAQWMAFAPDAFERAIADGALGAENVLLHVLQRALPREQWPPPADSAQAGQYQGLVKVVAEWLTIEPEPQPRLKVVE